MHIGQAFPLISSVPENRSCIPNARRVTCRLGDVTFRFTTSYNCYVINHSYAIMKNSYGCGRRLFSQKGLYLYNMQEKTSIMCLSSGWEIRPSGSYTWAGTLGTDFPIRNSNTWQKLLLKIFFYVTENYSFIRYS